MEKSYIDFEARDFIPLKGFGDYLSRNKRYTDTSMSDYEKGFRVEIAVKSTILGIYNFSILTGVGLGLIYGLEKMLS